MAANTAPAIAGVDFGTVNVKAGMSIQFDYNGTVRKVTVDYIELDTYKGPRSYTIDKIGDVRQLATSV